MKFMFSHNTVGSLFSIKLDYRTSETELHRFHVQLPATAMTEQIHIVRMCKRDVACNVGNAFSG